MITVGPVTLDLAEPQVQAWAAIAALVLLALVLLVRAMRAASRSARLLAPLGGTLDRLTRRLDDLGAAQASLAGGLGQVTEAQAVTQAQMMATLERRLEEVTRSTGDSLHGASTRTARSLGALQQRLETIDRAQANIEKLSGDVLGLQDILSNKQARGAFGEIQLADIVRKALPPDSYGFQVTLGNGRRADCLVRLPSPPGPLVIDSKFPLEAYEALMRARTDHERAAATRAFRNAVRAHVRAISERYIVKGETGEGALMFLPSEAVYAELHANFGMLVREAFAARVWIVSPTTCMATLNTLRAVLKDVRMKEQAALIRQELARLHDDVSRMAARMDNLERHFGQAQGDLADLRVSTDKVALRARRIEAVEFEADDSPRAAAE